MLNIIFEYNHDSGLLRRIDGNKRALTKWRQGSLTAFNYRAFKVNGRVCLAHILAYALYYGNYPENYVDHINGNPSDNRICNLRPATHRENMCNMKLRKDNTSGFQGVTFNRNSKKWQASIRVKGKKIHLGYFKSPDEARDKYLEAVAVYNGEFSRLSV